MASQQLLLGVGAGVKPGTYMDAMYKQQMHVGNGSSKTISTGFNMSGGAAVIVKNIEDGYDFQMSNSVRGATKVIEPNTTAAEDTEVQRISSFTSTGFTVGNANETNYSNKKHVSYAFKEEPGFFDIVTYTGNGSARSISHSLGCKPAMIWIKELSGTEPWRVYHHATGPEYYHCLNTNNARADDVNHWSDTYPTDSVFHLGINGAVNTNGESYIAYLWGFGSSPTYAGNFGTNKQLHFASDSNLQMSTGAFCIECFFKCTDFSTNPVICDTRSSTSSNDGIVIFIATNGKPAVYNSGSGSMCGAGAALSTDTWYHIAVTRSSTTIKLYIDGNLHNGTGTLSNNNLADQVLKIGDIVSGDNTQTFTGQISNFRYTKGIVRYDQTKFGAPSAPLAFDGKTSLLCLNKSLPLLSSKNIFSAIQQFHGDGDVTMSYEEKVGYQGGNLFGKDGKQSCIAVGEYYGNNQTSYGNHPEIYLGWEPEWVLVKNATQGDGWHFRDTVRGLDDDGVADPQLRFDSTGGDENNKHAINVQPYGFDVNSNNPEYNNDGVRYIYFAIRRPDGWVGTPVTNAEKAKFFESKTGQSDSTFREPNFSPSMVPDFHFRKVWESNGQPYYTGTRITGQEYLQLGAANNSNAAAANVSGSKWYFPTGYGHWQLDLTANLSWNWRRYGGFDISLYTGTGSSTNPCIIQHGLGVKPEMVWFKKRNEADPWIVYHSGLGGGTSPETYILRLNYNMVQSSGQSGYSYDDRRITLTTTWDQVNDVNINHIALLFASVEGVSKCGHYAGSDSTTSINCGFQPRFLLIKNIDNAQDWAMFTKSNVTDMGSGNDHKLSLSTDSAAQANVDWGAFTSTGFDLVGNYNQTNNSGHDFIYYAHA